MKKKIRAYLVFLKYNNPWLLLIWHKNQQRKGVQNLKSYSDIDAIHKLYLGYSGKPPNLENPKTFSEKQQWLKLNYHNPLMTICADKQKVRAYLMDKGYKNILSNIIGYYKSLDEVIIENLPNKFVLKAAHGSGWNLIVNDKRKVSWKPWKKIMQCWLDDNIFWPGREWPYKNMPAGIICEEYMEDKSGQLMDYKFFCFNGEVKFVQANKGRDTNEHAQNFYDLDWNILPFGKDLEPLPHINIEQPESLKEMISIAKDLSKDFPFVRVDLYEVNGKVIFGEMTFFPKSGLPDFTPIKYDAIIGDMLKLPEPII